jgi:hypothetical protein
MPTLDRFYSLLRKILVRLGCLFVGLLVLVVILFLIVEYRQESERAQWKTETLAQLAKKDQTDPFVQSDLATLTADSANTQLGTWAGNQVIRMINGEYLIYAFWHGSNMGYVDHLFLAHGSNGRWYYSTYHFCQQLVAIRSDDPPASIADFATKYSLSEFDGQSDICLNRTWPE